MSVLEHQTATADLLRKWNEFCDLWENASPATRRDFKRNRRRVQDREVENVEAVSSE